jgi:hypothetical protein
MCILIKTTFIPGEARKATRQPKKREGDIEYSVTQRNANNNNESDSQMMKKITCRKCYYILLLSAQPICLV